MADPPFAVLRADADPNIGMGHLMRTLALGEGLVELGWRVALAFNAPPEVAPATETASIAWSPVSGHTGTVEDALQVAALEPDLVVVDGYQFDASFYVELGDRGCRYAVIDDNGETSARDPVLVLNQNPHAAASTYAHLPSSRLLLGLEFALLRRAIRDIEAEGGGAEHRARVLVSIGGSDPLGLTVPVVTELAHLDVDLRVAIGPSNPCGDEIRKSVQDLKCAVAIDPATYVAEHAPPGARGRSTSWVQTSAAFGLSLYFLLAHGDGHGAHSYFEASAVVVTLTVYSNGGTFPTCDSSCSTMIRSNGTTTTVGCSEAWLTPRDETGSSSSKRSRSG